MIQDLRKAVVETEEKIAEAVELYWLAQACEDQKEINKYGLKTVGLLRNWMLINEFIPSQDR